MSLFAEIIGTIIIDVVSGTLIGGDNNESGRRSGGRRRRR